ncbi:MAG: hypothetical protein NVV82_16510 [Sporocytophaga sp.]|nr:hypothetical protein [Sporocytophaga sp.]
MNKIRIITFILSVILICSCTRVRLHTTKYPLVDNKSIGFGMDKDSIPRLTKINYEDIDDENRSYYYLKDQILFDSLILGFYKDRLYRYDGIIISREKTDELYTYLCNNFKGKKSDKTKYFKGGDKNFYLNMTSEFSDSSFTFTFFERNIYDAFIFHCFSSPRIYFWKGPYYYWRYERRLQEKKRKKIAKLLGLKLEN